MLLLRPEEGLPSVPLLPRGEALTLDERPVLMLINRIPRQPESLLCEAQVDVPLYIGLSCKPGATVCGFKSELKFIYLFQIIETLTTYLCVLLQFTITIQYQRDSAK